MPSLTSDQVSQLLESAAPGATMHLVGAGGCGMSGLGHLFLDLGLRVTGSDLVANDDTRALLERGGHIHAGHDARHVTGEKPLLVVYSTAVRLNNPELQAAGEMQIPIARRGVVLAALTNRRQGICIAGMHGKTTTSALLAFALENLSANPNYAVGARVPQLRRHARLSQSRTGFQPVPPIPSAQSSEGRAGCPSYFVAEADESDGTLRDFRPRHAIVLNVDAEHLDYFADLDAICREFAEFAAHTTGHLLFCADDTRLAELFARHPGAISYGFHPLATYRLTLRLPEAPHAPRTTHHASFTVWQRGLKLGDFSTRLLGEKNISNAGAVIVLLHTLGYSAEQIAPAIRDFTGAARRQEQLFADARFRLFDDYGHHPAEIQATLKAFKALAPRRLLVAFQPHRYTRTQALLPQFATCFADADQLWVTDIYAASEPPIPGVSGERLVQAIREASRGGAHPLTPALSPSEGEREKRGAASGEASRAQPSTRSSIDPTLPTVLPRPRSGGEGRGEGAAPDPRSQTPDPITFIPALARLRDAVRAAMLPGDVVLFLGAGDITVAAHELAAALREETVTPNEELFADLAAALSPASTVRRDEPLAKRTTLRVGGKADFYVEPASEDDLSRTLKFCAAHQLKFTLLGRGSNLLIRDGGIRGVVIHLAHPNFSRLEILGDKLHCGAGVKLKAISVEARRAGLTGLEFLEGIPGSLGGSMRMNAGAMGSWLFDVVERIRFMDYAGEAHERVAAEVNVEYRGCPLFKNHIAIGAVLKGVPAPAEAVAERMQKFSAKRWESQPAAPSAGCIFKNPPTIPAGKLIDELGLKGTRVGGAVVSDVHGNFIVNDASATAQDVLNLIAEIKQRVRTARGIELQTEVEILGDE